MRTRVVLAATLAALLGGTPLVAQLKPSDERVPIKSYKDLFVLFDRLGYTQKAWQAGIREVPRIYMSDIPDRWSEKTSKEITVADKKRLFFRLIAPIVLRINEIITADRARAKELMGRLALGEGVGSDDRMWLQELAARYKVIKSVSDNLDSDSYPELLSRVDIIPASLSLAQAASESGWGTSRFAAEGNSLFGQWTWGAGLTPKEQRTEAMGDHRVAAFGTTSEDAYAYTLNLNTQGAYRDLRLKRADLRRQSLRISGEVLVGTLLRYSERGQAYVDDLKKIMTQNRLADADDAHLRDMPVIRLDAVEPGPEKSK